MNDKIETKPSPLELVQSLILKLNEERNVPQFLFNDRIGHSQALSVRNQVDEFKTVNNDANEIDIILQSPGGSPDHAYRIIRTFRKSFTKVNIIIPFWAKSAATLLTLGATQIVMNDYGELGPLDMQIKVDDSEKPDIETQSALIDEQSLKRLEQRAMEMYLTMYGSFTRSSDKKIRINRTVLSNQLLTFVAEFYKPLISKIDPLAIGTKRRYLDLGEQYAGRLMYPYNKSGTGNIETFIDYLVNGCPDHGYVIDYDIVSMFLINVAKSKEISNDYDNILTQISKIFLSQSVESYVGFVLQATQEPHPDTDTNTKSIKEGGKDETKKPARSKRSKSA